MRPIVLAALACLILAACKSDEQRLADLRGEIALASLQTLSVEENRRAALRELGHSESFAITSLDRIPGTSATYADCAVAASRVPQCDLYDQYHEAIMERLRLRDRITILERDRGRLLR